MSPAPSLTLAQARRVALAAQGLARPRPDPFASTTRHLRQVVDTVQVVQIDSVNVLARSHYLPFFSRLGPYRPELLDRMRDGRGARGTGPRGLVEYLAHEASLVPPSTWPLLGGRMRAHADRDGPWAARVEQEHPGVQEAVLDAVRDHGPLTSREAEAVLQHDGPRPRDSWGWNWSVVKDVLEWHFRTGRLTSAGRTPQFERRYALPEHVLPPEILAAGPGGSQEIGPDEATRQLLRHSLRAHGIGSARCLLDYFRLRGPVALEALRALVDAGEAEPVQVDGWDTPLYLDPEARRPRSVTGRALLSPFDSLIWERQRTERLFGFRYRLEIYVPQAKRVHGYYVLPFLLGEDLVARVDLKADRARGSLLARSVHLEPGAPQGALAELRAELRLLADWLGLDRVEVT